MEFIQTVQDCMKDIIEDSNLMIMKHKQELVKNFSEFLRVSTAVRRENEKNTPLSAGKTMYRIVSIRCDTCAGRACREPVCPPV